VLAKDDGFFGKRHGDFFGPSSRDGRQSGVVLCAAAQVHTIDGLSGGAVVAQPVQPDKTVLLPARLTTPPHQLAVAVKP
jgi:hypothetical protein